MYWNTGPKANKVPTCKCRAHTVSKNNIGMMVAGLRPITMEKVSYSVSMSAERIFRDISQAVMGIETIKSKMKWMVWNDSYSAPEAKAVWIKKKLMT